MHAHELDMCPMSSDPMVAQMIVELNNVLVTGRSLTLEIVSSSLPPILSMRITLAKREPERICEEHFVITG